MLHFNLLFVIACSKFEPNEQFAEVKGKEPEVHAAYLLRAKNNNCCTGRTHDQIKHIVETLIDV